VIPEQVERRARWVLDSIGATEIGFGDDVPYRAEAWEAVERRERPVGDDVAEAFFHLARVEERDGPRDEHGRFLAAWSCLDPLDPPLERVRMNLGVRAPRYDGATFAVALTHDVDSVRRWTEIGVRGAAARLKGDVRRARFREAAREATGLALVPLHRVRGTDPNWRFDRIAAATRRYGASGSTFFVLGGHGDPHDGSAPATYERLRPVLLETLAASGAEVALHGSYRTADDASLLVEEKRRLEGLGATIHGQRFHYLRVDPHRNLAAVADAGFAYDSSLGFPDAIGFRAGIARPFRPWDFEHDRPFDLVEVPLAIMDVTLAERRYLGFSPRSAWNRITRLLDYAARHGTAFAILWHPDRFDPPTSGGWDRFFYRLIDAVGERGGTCMAAQDLAAMAMATTRP
jgi:peptidoglycan/xylan/chitin deacetylase (PgdA/CDA1 family)